MISPLIFTIIVILLFLPQKNICLFSKKKQAVKNKLNSTMYLSIANLIRYTDEMKKGNYRRRIPKAVNFFI